MTTEIPTPGDPRKESGAREPETKKENREPSGPTKRSFTETLESLKKNDKIESLYSYAKSNTLDTVAYIALILGIVWLFFSSFWGGILVGMVFGFYFSDELSAFVSSINTSIEEQGMVRSLVFGGTLLAFFISGYGIFIGAALVVGLKELIASGNKT